MSEPGVCKMERAVGNRRNQGVISTDPFDPYGDADLDYVIKKEIDDPDYADFFFRVVEFDNECSNLTFSGTHINGSSFYNDNPSFNLTIFSMKTITVSLRRLCPSVPLSVEVKYKVLPAHKTSTSAHFGNLLGFADFQFNFSVFDFSIVESNYVFDGQQPNGQPTHVNLLNQPYHVPFNDGL
ncbi:hypothetical protein L596_021452 [Steinernema carpocapsae]|uniref:Uncharacterized protein n=1 Tax=Steinernema carpocapsae TaxID=34508 RepID=A0A4U5MIV0_STECR|nr:hypothetical protein L596_021452 [Steinernema carpocapsae]